MTKIETALTRLLGITHPILLAPMGSAAGGRLAAAVTHAGGLGLIGSGYAEAGAITRELVAAGNARVGVGFITWALDARPEVLHVALAARPAAIMLSFGDPMPYLAAIRDAGSKVICQVQTLAEAEQAARLGVDVIVAQGRDAGGHSGTTRGTMGFVPAVVDLAGPIPVVAALSLGAAGVSMGTRFTATRESLWDEAMKSRVIGAVGDQTAQTRVFDIVRGAPWPAHYPGRALRNDFFQRWHGQEESLEATRADEEKNYLGTRPDDFSTRVVWAGEGVDLVRDAPSAAEVIERIVAEAASVLTRGAALVR